MSTPPPDGARRPLRRQVGAAALVLGLLGAGVVVTTADGSSPDDDVAGPTAEAQPRSLRVLDTELGNLARADTTVVVYDGTGGSVGGGPPGSSPEVRGMGAGTATIADLAPAAEPCPSTTTTSTTAPCDAASTTSTSWPRRPDSQTTLPPPTTSTTAPFLPEEPSPEEPAPEEPAPGDGEVTGGPSLPTGQDDGADQATGDPSATLTELLAIGEATTRGTVLYRADDEPIVALLAPTPLFRELAQGVDDGADVLALEQNLAELGYGGLDVDEHFDAATKAAVRAWEEDLGREVPDGVVTVGEVTYLEEPATVLAHEAVVGDLLVPGDAVLELGAESRVVETDVLADEAADWPVGTVVTLDWGDGTTSTGTVTEVARDVVAGEVALVVSLADGGGADRPVGSAADVVRTVAERSAVVAVPVAAVVAGDDGPAVRVADGAEDRLVPVELGLVDDGWVEVVDGLEPGTTVRLPG